MKITSLIINRSIIPSFKNISSKFIKNKLTISRAFFVATFTYAIFNHPKLFCIEDKALTNLKNIFNTSVNQMKTQFGQMSIYPTIKYNLRGNIYSVQFQIDQRKTDIFEVLATFLAEYSNVEGFRITNSKTIKQQAIITLELEFQQKDPRTQTPNKGSITITGIMTDQRPNFRVIFQKHDVLTNVNNNSLIKTYKQSIKPRELKKIKSRDQNKANQSTNTSFFQKVTGKQNQNIKKLQELGVMIFKPEDKIANLDWDYLAGYQKQKRDIEDTILLALSHPHIYDQITINTRVKNQPNRPKAVLFQGPPGTGKTTSAKIIAQQVQIPLIYLPIQAIMSKYYGESQKKLSDMWELCKKIGKVIIFVDEIDALAGNRSSDMHEASRRILSTLLRKIDSFESTTDVLFICATNRKRDLDPAMLSRIDLSIKFDLPDKLSRAAIFKRYAKHLTDKERLILAQNTQGFSGRNISDICKNAQRKWASKLIRKEVEQKLPSMEQYMNSLKIRRENDLQ